MDEQAPDKTPATEPAPDSVANESKLDATKQTSDAPGENTRSRNFKEDARKAAEGVKNLKESLKTHDFKAELRDAFAETKKNPASIWKKPETLRPGKDLAIVGLAASVVLLLLLLVTSSSILGLVCLVLGLGALLFSALGLKTEGRKLAVGGSVVGLLVVLCALGQIFEPGTKPEDDGSVKIAVSSGSKSGKNSTTGDKAVSLDDLKPEIVPNQGRESASVDDILAAAENAKRIKGLGFAGFYTGMSLRDACLLAKHYGLDVNKDICFWSNNDTGEVYEIHFTPTALDLVAELPNNFPTAKDFVMGYYGIDDVRKFLNDEGDFRYTTSYGVLVGMNVTSFGSNGNNALFLRDTNRKAVAERVNIAIQTWNKIVELTKAGVRTKVLKLSDNAYVLLQEIAVKDKGQYSAKPVWMSTWPIMRFQFEAVTDWKSVDYLSSTAKYNRSSNPGCSDIVEFDKSSGYDNPKKDYDRRLFCEKLNALPAEKRDGLVFSVPSDDIAAQAEAKGLIGWKQKRKILSSTIIETLLLHIMAPIDENDIKDFWETDDYKMWSDYDTYLQLSKGPAEELRKTWSCLGIPADRIETFLKYLGYGLTKDEFFKNRLSVLKRFEK